MNQGARHEVRSIAVRQAHRVNGYFLTSNNLQVVLLAHREGISLVGIIDVDVGK